MKKQKICIIGGGLTGLITAIVLSKLNCEIDLITGNINRDLKVNRTIAISESNFHFLNKIGEFEFLKKDVWFCSIMKLYTEGKNKNLLEIFELNKESKKEKVLYMLENSKIMRKIINKIKKNKSITIKDNTKASSILNSGLLTSVKFKNNISNYNLVIVCAGNNSDLLKSIFNDSPIYNSYEETAITTTITHSSIKNNTARQFFLNNEILALLPISNIQTSIVWTIKNNKSNKNLIFLKNKIKFYAKNFLKNVKTRNKIEFKNLNLLIRKKYFSNRTLLFGDALHVIHPFIGQGFNMTLRDLISLEKILKKKINLGLDIGSPDILSEFCNEAKPRNFAFLLGADILKSSFSYKKFRDGLLKIANKNIFIKNVFFDFANKGFKF